ncbi:UDP-glycosyltransferase 74E2 [Dichanthelium oligosanthes]|uniref:Glycosyltransferase n=1 Tax=Dichanthelium oligosanthes TaxID=888268 RepID=A0A1E5VA53_9POAL|nr:UDP-glycosyltransferase 74E2 [Dichanthelium oligosanthes]
MVNFSDHRLHILVLPYPSQGHINPLFHFAKRLAGHSGVRSTLAVTRFVASSARRATGSVHVAVFSDGCDDVGPDGVGGHRGPYFERLNSAGPESVDWLLRSESELGRPVHVVVYDAFLPWAQGLARRHGAACAAFLTQTCAVDVLYTHLRAGRIPQPPVREEELPPELAGLPSQLELTDLPTFMVDKNRPPGLLELLMNQFVGLDTVDHVLVNSFYDLEPQEADYLASTWGAKTVGPTMPSVHLDSRLPRNDDDDASYGIHLQTPMASESKAWLDGHPLLSVVYVSFGSIASLSSEQMAEVAEGLYSSGKPFLWVVRATETRKLPANFAKKAKGRGLIVPWCQQLEVLAHPSVGCFVTHCGWNSTLEAITAGVPIVAMPHWSDQPTNAKYVQDAWRVGVRVLADSQGVTRREEVDRCVRHVMEGEMCKEFKTRALEWSKKAKKAMSKGGSSDINILDFLSKFGYHK